MPTELRNRVTRIEIEGEESAGAVLLVDERWRRRPVGIAAAPNTAGQPLLSENYYLERALGPFTEMRRGSADRSAEARARGADLFRCRPEFAGARRPRSRKWIEDGGLLLRFAGPHLAEQGDQLLPVRLRTAAAARSAARCRGSSRPSSPRSRRKARSPGWRSRPT